MQGSLVFSRGDIVQIFTGFNLYIKAKVIKSLLVIRVTKVSWHALILTHG